MYGEHHGVLVMVVMVTVMVFNFSIPCTPCTLTCGVWVYHSVRVVQTAGVCWGAHRAWVGVVIQRVWWWRQGDGDGGSTETAAAAAQRGQRWRQRGWWHREGGGGSGTEKAVAVAWRGR